MSSRRLLPEGLVQGCVLRRDVAQDEVITYDDVDLPPGRLADRLRAEQYELFRGEILAGRAVVPDDVCLTGSPEASRAVTAIRAHLAAGEGLRDSARAPRPPCREGA